MSNIIKFIIFLFFVFPATKMFSQACYPNQVVTSAYATGGTSLYKDKVLWLTWGSTAQNQNIYPYGRHGQDLSVGAKSRASIHLGGNSYLCIEVEITSINGGSIKSYAPGNYGGDSMDKLYNIGGTGSDNKLVSGLINKTNGSTSTINFKAKATINGEPIRLPGLAIADAESLANNKDEYIKATAKGVWNIVDVRKNTSSTSYEIGKRDAGNNQQRIEFIQGNDANTGAVAFCEFNEFAYNKNDGFSVTFSAELKGRGLTALAIGLLTPSADVGDAPVSYGSPIHLIQNISIVSDNINVSSNRFTNINDKSYTPGSLKLTEGKFLGSMPPDNDNSPKYSKNALGDDISGSGGINEEDAWPEALRRISYKSNYKPGSDLVANIPFKNGVVGDYISGWIDFNLNGVFDESERQTKKITSTDISNGYVQLNWVIPNIKKLKSTYVRLRYFDSKEDFISSTQSVNFGEVEDHKMHIIFPRKTNPTLRGRFKE